MYAKALKLVYRHVSYLILSLAVAFITFALIVWFPNLELIKDVVGAGDIAIASKAKLLVSLLGAIGTNFTFFTAAYAIILSILFGLYIGMMAYFIRRRIKGTRQSGASVGILGMLSGIVGVGCAACGSFLLTSFSLVGATGLLAALPLEGGEFALLGMILLAIALHITAKKIQSPLICRT